MAAGAIMSGNQEEDVGISRSSWEFYYDTTLQKLNGDKEFSNWLIVGR